MGEACCYNWATSIESYCHCVNGIYYIKVSGIPSGKKLIKTIRYPHM